MSKNVNKNLHPKKNTVKAAPKLEIKKGKFSALIILVTITFLCFIPALKNNFTNWDDQQYIIDNPLVKSLSFENIKEIFIICIDKHNMIQQPKIS